jgi:hypothetical protein
LIIHRTPPLFNSNEKDRGIFDTTVFTDNIKPWASPGGEVHGVFYSNRMDHSYREPVHHHQSTTLSSSEEFIFQTALS